MNWLWVKIAAMNWLCLNSFIVFKLESSGSLKFFGLEEDFLRQKR
jgi:hypothetical protein